MACPGLSLVLMGGGGSTLRGEYEQTMIGPSKSILVPNFVKFPTLFDMHTTRLLLVMLNDCTSALCIAAREMIEAPKPMQELNRFNLLDLGPFRRLLDGKPASTYQ